MLISRERFREKSTYNVVKVFHQIQKMKLKAELTIYSQDIFLLCLYKLHNNIDIFWKSFHNLNLNYV